jgi:predicted O-methyltransferase YrrM
MSDRIEEICSSWKGEAEHAKAFTEHMCPNDIVEIGVERGYSLAKWSQWFPDANVIGVDFYLDEKVDFHRQVLKMIEDHGFGRTELWRLDSLSAAADWAHLGSHPIDILHIDADHDYESVKRDFDAWKMFVRDHGAILFHDIISHIDGAGKFFFEQVKGLECGKDWDANVSGNGIGVIYKGGK